jgi:hypothetical protein
LTLASPSDSGEHPFRVSGRNEGFGIEVRLGIDGDLKINDKSEHTALEVWPVSLAKKPLTASNQDADVGVKWTSSRDADLRSSIWIGSYRAIERPTTRAGGSTERRRGRN